jgi:hypothetical protein
LLSTEIYLPLMAAGFEKRGEIIRLVQTLRGGDRPKNAHEEFSEVSVMPRSGWEPWGLFRKPCEGRVQDNLRKWGTGGLRRISSEAPFGDVIVSAPTRGEERAIAPHPSLKPQALMRQLVRAALPLGEGVVLDPFMGGGATIAAAMAVGYASIGVEIDPAFFAVAERAIEPLSRLPVPERPGARRERAADVLERRLSARWRSACAERLAGVVLELLEGPGDAVAGAVVGLGLESFVEQLDVLGRPSLPRPSAASRRTRASGLVRAPTEQVVKRRAGGPGPQRAAGDRAHLIVEVDEGVGDQRGVLRIVGAERVGGDPARVEVAGQPALQQRAVDQVAHGLAVARDVLALHRVGHRVDQRGQGPLVAECWRARAASAGVDLARKGGEAGEEGGCRRGAWAWCPQGRRLSSATWLGPVSPSLSSVWG